MPAAALAKKNIFVIDEHPVIIEGLSQMIANERDLAVCGNAPEPTQALQKVSTLKPHLVITDISLEGTDGLQLTRSLRKKFPDTRLLVFSMRDESVHAERAIKAGANGYVMKTERRENLISAIRQVLNGKTYVSSRLNEQILQRLSPEAGKSNSQIADLSDRELSVFELIGRGYNTRKIAEQLHMAMKTVESHRLHIKEKLNLHNTVELVQRAIRWVHEERGY